jgi:hypothetical protein
MGPRVSKKRLQVLEKIMKSGELWFSNPLFMNDLEEMRFGIHEGVALFESSDAVDRACNTPQRAHAVKHHLRHYFNQFDNQHAFDVYVFCFSEHLPEKTDGILSMWRGYGGQGNGAALVFNTGFITPRAESPLILSKVHYDSKDNRVKFINEKLNEWCAIVNSAQLQDDQILPIRLTQIPTTCRMRPVAGIKLGKGWRVRAARYSEQGPEGVERVVAPVEAERELVQVGL